MKKSQLISVFLGLNGTEKRALNKFVASPFFNQREEVVALWRYLIDHAPEGALAFRKEQIFDSIFPGDSFNDKKLRHVCSWLLRCIEDYLAYAVYKRTPIIETLHKSQAYKDKKLNKHFQKTLRTTRQQLKQMPHGPDFFYMDYSIGFENYRFLESKNRISENNLRQMTISLDKFLLMSKLKQACVVHSHRSVFTTEYDLKFTNLLLTFLKGSLYLEEPGIACYYYCYRALSENNEDCFNTLRSTMDKYQKTLPAEDIYSLYFSSINFCIRQINTGVSKYRRVVFDLYRSGLKEGLLIQGGELSRFTYNNIVSSALAFSEFLWVEKFIHDYKSMIDPRYRENNFIYNLAKLNFTAKDYDHSMKLLIQVDERDLLLNIDAKIMLLKIYFDRNEYDTLSSLLSSITTWLRRKKILSYHKKHYQNFIRFASRILHLKPGDEKAYKKLKSDIEGEQEMGSKEWLLEQLG